MRWPASFVAGGRAFLLESGVTSKEPYCLVVADGLVSVKGAPMLLEKCRAAIQKGDGRELLEMGGDGQLRSVISGRCVQTQPGDFDELQGLPLQLGECASEGQRSLVWDLTPAGRWRQMLGSDLEPSSTPGPVGGPPGGGLCLSLRGPRGVMGDVDVAGKAFRDSLPVPGAPWGQPTPGAPPPPPPPPGVPPAPGLPTPGHRRPLGAPLPEGEIEPPKASSEADSLKHGANRVIDDWPESYWASEKDPLEPVTFEIPLDKERRLSRVDITWERAPLSFTVETRSEGTEWMRRYSSARGGDPAAAPSMSLDGRTSVVPLHGLSASEVRIAMTGRQGAHLEGEVSSIENPHYYAIRKVAVRSPRLQPVLEPCAGAIRQADGRSRWFLTGVNEFNPLRRYVGKPKALFL